VFFVSGCERHGQHTDDDAHEHGRGGHDGRSHEEGAELVTYAAGRGLRFAPEVAEAMGLRTVSVVPGRIPRVISLVAEVVDATRAVAFVPLARAGDFSAGQIFEASVGGKDVAGARFTARLHSISRESQRAMGSVEVLFEVASEDVPRGELRAGGVIALTRLVPPAGEVPSIPREALLETAGGTFVYGVKEGSYYRIPVRAGAVGASDVAIVSGLSAGDVVVAEPVSQLWLAELRLTRGGGHSH
jgi:hypothetical protein